MELIRCFLAIDPGESLRARLAALRGALAAHFSFPALRWVQPSDYHLTLVFLGQVRADEIERIHACVALLAPELHSLRYRLASVQAFPDVHRPRVVAALPADPQPFLCWQEPLAAALAGVGFSPERRAYRPHLSLGRWRSRLPCPQQEGFDLALDAEADAITLYESRGGHYQPLFRECCAQGCSGE